MQQPNQNPNQYGHQQHVQNHPQQHQQLGMPPQQLHQPQPNQGFQQFQGHNPHYGQQHHPNNQMNMQYHPNNQHNMMQQHHPQQHHSLPPQHLQHQGHHNLPPPVMHQNPNQMMNMPQNHVPQMPGDHGDHGVGHPNLDKRTYRKKKTWMLYLNITIETPELDNRLNESFEIEIGSNQRLKILHGTILSSVKNLELREMLKKEKTYIYIEGKEPVARKSKSLAEMGVKDGDHLIVTTEMKLPFDEISEEEDPIMDFPGQMNMPNEDPYDMSVPVNAGIQNPIEFPNRTGGQLTPPNNREPNHQQFLEPPQNQVLSNLPANQQENLGIKPQNHQMQQSAFQKQAIKPNGPNSVNGQPIPKMNPSIKPQSKDINKPKNQGKPQKNPGERKKDAAPKSPAQRKAKEIQYVKIMIVQQYFKNEDLKRNNNQEEEEEPVIVPDIADDEQEKNEENADGEENKQDENQIDSAVVNNEEEHQNDEPVAEESHDPYQESNGEDQEHAEPYDPNAEMQLDINRTNKVKSLKRAILDKIKLNHKTNIIIFKKVDGQIDSTENAWTKLTEEDNEQQVKTFENKLLAFKCYFEVNVSIDGRGQSYKLNLKVDPKDSLDKYMRKNTHFWRIFMSRGQNRCVAAFLNKGDKEQNFIEPDQLEQTFEELGITNQSQITLFEIPKNFGDDQDEGDEGGEEEFEEMDEAEGEAAGEGAEQAAGTQIVGDNFGNQAPAQLGLATLVEEPEDPEMTKKASDVLFNDPNDVGGHQQ